MDHINEATVAAHTDFDAELALLHKHYDGRIRQLMSQLKTVQESALAQARLVVAKAVIKEDYKIVA